MILGDAEQKEEPWLCCWRPKAGLPAEALGLRGVPRPGPRRRFLPRARHVTAIKHVCVRFAAVTS